MRRVRSVLTGLVLLLALGSLLATTPSDDTADEGFDEVGRVDASEHAVIRGCRTVPDGYAVEVEVTNKATGTARYVVQVEIQSPDGERVGASVAEVRDLLAGERRVVEVTSTGVGPPSDIRCEVLDVDRDLA